jgi:predicted nucleic acid-binding Zn ribbon protein
MQKAAPIFVPSVKPKAKRHCLSCGKPLTPRLRRYCNMSCPQYLLASLNRRTGLLQTLSIRYGTFYFSDFLVVMDLLPYDSDQIYSYMLPRSAGHKPVEDFCELSNILGTLWWNEKNRTKKRYLASREVLSRGRKLEAPINSVMPASLTVPSVRSSNLITLELQPDDLAPTTIEQSIRNAYRRQAKKHHPDLGAVRKPSSRSRRLTKSCASGQSTRPSSESGAFRTNGFMRAPATAGSNPSYCDENNLSTAGPRHRLSFGSLRWSGETGSVWASILAALFPATQ